MFLEIPIDEIKLGKNVRKKINTNGLGLSIKEVGLLNPVTVIEQEDGSFELISGFRRLKAVKELNWDKISCNVIDGLDDLKKELAAIDENLERTMLSPTEEDEALLRRKDIYETLHPETKQHIIGGKNKGKEKVKSFIQDTHEKTGKSISSIKKSVKRARDLTDEVKEKLNAGEITKSEADSISSLEPEEQREVIKRKSNPTAETDFEDTLHEINTSSVQITKLFDQIDGLIDDSFELADDINSQTDDDSVFTSIERLMDKFSSYSNKYRFTRLQEKIDKWLYS